MKTRAQLLISEKIKLKENCRKMYRTISTHSVNLEEDA